MIEIKYKQYVIVPKQPKMSPGKIASQVAHATFMALEKQRPKTFQLRDDNGELTNKHVLGQYIIDKWKRYGMCVVVLKCKDATQLMGIAKYLDQWNVINHMYIDEGMTEVHMGTPTALATAVLNKKDFWMLSNLEPYK